MTLHINIQGHGYPLVLFHGWGFDSQIWSDVIPQLQPHYTLYCVDLPGFGRTDLMEWGDFKRILLSQLPTQFAVLGWSLGGLYAMRLAIEEGERVSHLISVASSPHLLKKEDWPGIEPSVFDEFAIRLQKDSQQTIQDFIVLQARNYFSSIDTVSNGNNSGNSPGLQLGLEVLMTWDFRELLVSYLKPGCFIFGRLDAIVPHQIVPIMQRNYPQFEYHLLKKSAHMPFLSHQDEFIQILRAFL